MQRIRQQEQPAGQAGLIGAEHARLAASIRMTAKEYAAGDLLPQFSHGQLQAFAVARCVYRAWRTEWPILAKSQIAAQHREPRATKGFRDGEQKR